MPETPPSDQPDPAGSPPGGAGAYRLPDASAKAHYVRRKFDEIARHYDLFNDLITQGQHRWWKRVVIRELALRPGMRGLDICCGTGDLAQRALRAMGAHPAGGGAGGPATGGVVAADFSANMLRIAQGRLHKAGFGKGGDAAAHPALLVTQADAMALPFADASFDFVTIGYGLRNVTDIPGCLAELRRVLRPGGRLASLDTGRVRNRILRACSNFYLFHIVPRIGRLLQANQDMFTYLPHSTLDFPPQDRLLEQLADAGFTETRLIEHLGGASAIHIARK